jgi:hypothetical protein
MTEFCEFLTVEILGGYKLPAIKALHIYEVGFV